MISVWFNTYIRFIATLDTYLENNKSFGIWDNHDSFRVGVCSDGVHNLTIPFQLIWQDRLAASDSFEGPLWAWGSRKDVRIVWLTMSDDQT